MKILLFLVFQFTASCLFAQNIGQVTQGVSILEKGLWPGKTCEVCWENPSPSNATERAWVRDAVQNTWEKESEFRFTGWGTCTATSRGIRIFITSNTIDTPHVKVLGAYLDGLKDGMLLNFNWTGCSEPGSERCVRFVAVHEFGHALGFAHEQNRNDAPLKCQEKAQGGDGDWWVTGYDAESVMNYCNPKWNNDGALSELDIYGVRFLYGGAGYMADPIIYTLNSKNELLWYKHTGHGSGSAEWSRNIGTKVGDGWDFNHIVNDGEGHIYAIRKNGEVLWYNHVGFHDGTYRWSQTSGAIIRYDWANDVQGVFAAGAGVIYVIKSNGDLIWYKHLGYHDGKNSWDAASGIKVGSGWNDFYSVFSGGNGVFYMVDKRGGLYWYKHAGVSTGSNKWYGGSSNKIGNGWNTKLQFLSTGAGNIYCVNPDGTLQYFYHQGFNNGYTAWQNSGGNAVGNEGWGKLGLIGMGSINRDAIGNARYTDNRVTSDIKNPSATPAPDLATYSNSSNNFGSDVKKAADAVAGSTNSNAFGSVKKAADSVAGSTNSNAFGSVKKAADSVAGSTNSNAFGSVKKAADSVAGSTNSNTFSRDVKKAAASEGGSTFSNSSEKVNDASKQILQTRARQLNWIEFKEYVFDGPNIQGALYNNGAIFIHNNRAFEMHGTIFYKWRSLGGYAAIGKPITDLSTCPDGAGQYNHFRHKSGWESSIYLNPKNKRAYWVHGAIRDFWIAEGWERGPSGYPTSDEKASNNNSFNRMQDFDKRQIYWSAKTGSKAVKYSTFD